MDQLHEPKSAALRSMFWRDEILQVMFWLQGEGFGDEIDPSLLERFLGVQALIAIQYLDQLTTEELLARGTDGRYALTPAGRQLGARVFADEFAELTKPGHGECGPDCWCHASPAEAEACVQARFGDPADGHHHGN